MIKTSLDASKRSGANNNKVVNKVNCFPSRRFRSEWKKLRTPAWTWKGTAVACFSNLWNFLPLMSKQKPLAGITWMANKSTPCSHPHGCGAAHHNMTDNYCLAHAGILVPASLILSNVGCGWWLPSGWLLLGMLQQALPCPKPAWSSQFGTDCWSSLLALFLILSPKKSVLP